MLKKTAIVGLLAGAAIVTGGIATSAVAQDLPTGGGGNGFCLAPWQWNGPGNIAITDQATSYAACNGDGTTSGVSAEGINIGNGSCLLPWQWNGPFTGLLEGNSTAYAACNG